MLNSKRPLIALLLGLLMIAVASANTLTIQQNQTAILQSSGASNSPYSGPYTYQWFMCTPSTCPTYSAISGATNTVYFWNTLSNTPTGTYSFILQGTDASSHVANSIATNVILAAIDNTIGTPGIQETQVPTPWNLIFILSIVIGIIFTIILIIVLGPDLKEKSIRPVFIIAIAMAAWFVSLPALTTQATVRISSPTYNIITPSGTVSVPSANIISYLNQPISGVSYSTYVYFWLFILFAHLGILFIYLYNIGEGSILAALRKIVGKG